MARSLPPPWVSALRSDAVRYTGKSDIQAIVRLALRNRLFRVNVTLRLTQACPPRWRFRRAASALLHRYTTSRSGIDLPPQTDIAGGLLLVHEWGIVINKAATIGRNATLFHGVTLGRADLLDERGRKVGGAPTVGDESWLGPHAVVVGDVIVGNGSRLLANSVTTTDIPENSLVGGIPSRVLEAGTKADVLNPAPAFLA